MPQSDGINKLRRMEFKFKENVYLFHINPEEYSQDEPSRSTVTQTKAGAFIDDFGGGLVTIFIKGSTGMRNGFEKFKELRDLIRNYKKSITPGAEVVDELIFHNYTDDESWVVHLDPSAFKLYRSKSNPLMFMYEIRLICLRGANEPKEVDKSENGVVPASDNVEKAKESIPKVENALGAKDGVIPNTAAANITSVQVLNNGAVQTTKAATTGTFTLFSNDAVTDMITPVLNPRVSSLGLDYHRKITAGDVPTSNDPLDTESLLYKVMYSIPPTMITQEEIEVLSMIFLEVYSIYKAYTSDITALSTRLSQEDIGRLINNIRWVSARLEEYDEPILYDIISGLREIETDMKHFKNAASLFTRDVSESLLKYNEAGS